MVCYIPFITCQPIPLRRGDFRIKNSGRMNVAEKRKPQDGRLKTRIPKGQETELRLSTLPTALVKSWSCVFLILEVLVRSFQQLGFEGYTLLAATDTA